jgi:hypothetical protein
VLVRDIIDRTYSELLQPGGTGREAYDVLMEDINASSDELMLEGRQTHIPNDTVVQINSERILVSDHDLSTHITTAKRRGYGESDASGHSEGDLVIIDPDFPRDVLFNHVKTTISQLYPLGLYRRRKDVSETFPVHPNNFLTLPTDARDVFSVSVEGNSGNQKYRLRKGHDYDVWHEFDPIEVEIHSGGTVGRDLTIIYKADYDTDNLTEETDLDNLGVPSTLQPYMPLAIAGFVLQGTEVPQIVRDEIKSLLASEGIQPGISLQYGQGLIQVFERVYVAREKTKLQEYDKPRIAYRGN